MSRPSSTAFQNRVQRYDKKSISASFCPPFCNHGGQNRMQIYDEHLVFCKFFGEKMLARPFSTDAKDNASVLKANDYVSLS